MTNNSDRQDGPENNVLEQFLGAFHRGLREGGPPVNIKILIAYVEDQHRPEAERLLSQKQTQSVRRAIACWKDWHYEHEQIRAALEMELPEDPEPSHNPPSRDEEQITRDREMLDRDWSLYFLRLFVRIRDYLNASDAPPCSASVRQTLLGCFERIMNQETCQGLVSERVLWMKILELASKRNTGSGTTVVIQQEETATDSLTLPAIPDDAFVEEIVSTCDRLLSQLEQEPLLQELATKKLMGESNSAVAEQLQLGSVQMNIKLKRVVAELFTLSTTSQEENS